MTAPETAEGWYVLHDIRRVDQGRWSALNPDRRQEIAEATAAWLARVAQPGAGAGSSAAYRMLGHKGDLLFLHLRRTLDELQTLEAGFDATPLAAYCDRPTSFVSVVELSLYGASEDVRRNPMSQPWLVRRLYPPVPDRRYVCFYPVNRRRAGEENWYALPFQTRRELLEAHGQTGRRYADRVTQMITGAIGLDDWEWGVTLWADDPLAFKKLVYEMRFDEISAKYAEFGPFYVGIRLAPPELARRLR